MKARILNRNGGREYEVDEGAVLSKSKDETLDNGTIIISNLENPIEIEPYDAVLLTGGYAEQSDIMCVDTYTRTQICLDPPMYKYEISLFSKTKELEGVLLPNLKITKVVGTPRSAWHYLDEYLKEYSPKIRVDDGEGGCFITQKYELDATEATTFFEQCPEMQWNRPTLREVLNDLAMTKDRIVYLDGNVVRFLDLTETQSPSENALSGVNLIQASKSSEDYVSALRCELVNVTNDGSGETNDFVTRTEWCPITSDAAIIDENNFVVKTDYPIYKLKKFVMKFPMLLGAGSSQNNGLYWFSADLMDCTLGWINGGETEITQSQHNCLVVETKEWQALAVHYDNWDQVPTQWYPLYKNFTLHYDRGSNVISGFNEKTQVWFMTNYMFTYLQGALLRGLSPFYATDAAGNVRYFHGLDLSDDYTDPAKYYDMVFEIEYETLAGCVFEAGKGQPTRNTRVVADNQSNSYVSSNLQGALEYMKANRLGNEQLLINATYRGTNLSESDMLRIGDVVDGCVVFKVERQIYRNHVEVNAYATKDYVLRNYYTGVKAKIRSWRVSDGSEALTRHDLHKIHLEFGFRQKTEATARTDVNVGGTLDTLWTDFDLPSYFLSPFVSENTASPIRHAIVKTEDASGTIYPASGIGANNWYSLDLSSRLVGNSIVFDIQFTDNYWVGRYIDKTSLTIQGNLEITGFVNGGIPTQYFRYTDQNGENVGGKIVLLSNMEMNPSGIQDYTSFYGRANGIQYQNPAAPIALEWIYHRPMVTMENYPNYETNLAVAWSNRKDMMEITAISLQYELCSDTTRIAFTRDFMKRQRCIRATDNDHSFQLVVGDSSDYNPRNPKVPEGVGGIPTTATITSYANKSAKLSFSTGYAGFAGKTAYITDWQGTLLLAIDQPTIEGGAISVWLNALVVRDDSIYDADLREEIVGHI